MSLTDDEVKEIEMLVNTALSLQSINSEKMDSVFAKSDVQNFFLAFTEFEKNKSKQNINTLVSKTKVCVNNDRAGFQEIIKILDKSKAK